LFRSGAGRAKLRTIEKKINLALGASDADAEPTRRDKTERLQLTVMFADLVRVTASRVKGSSDRVAATDYLFEEARRWWSMLARYASRTVTVMRINGNFWKG
jgi:class 3 adenylate cyclase